MLRISTALFLLFASAFAGAETFSPHGSDYWEFYAYGNAVAIKAVLLALSQIVSTPTFVTMCMTLAIGGFAASGATGLISGNPAKFFGYIVGLFILVYAIFNMKMNVQIREMVYVPGGSSSYELVQGVPGAVALPTVVISKVGKVITDFMATFMVTPSGDQGLPMGSLPFGAGMGIAQDMAKIKLANPYLKKNFNNWVADCLAPEIYTGRINVNGLANSNNIMEYIKDQSSRATTSRTQLVQMTYLTGSTKVKAQNEPTSSAIENFSGILSCSEAFPVLNGQLEAEIGAATSSILSKVSPMLAADGLMNNGTAAIIAEQVAGGAMGSATNVATQGAVIDLMHGFSAYQAQALDADASMMALNLNNARRSQTTGWYTASVLFRDMGGYFYAILQVFLIGITPLIAVLMFVPGMGAKLGGSYIKACIWLASWWPALQIVNFIMELYYQSSAKAAYGPVGGLSMVNQGLVSTFSDNMIIAAGFMATLVPTVMWGIINGAGIALTSVLDRASGSSYASSAAQDAAAGNFRAGNVGMNSFSANKWDSSVTFGTGYQAAQQHYGLGSTETIHNAGGPEYRQNGGKLTKQYGAKETEDLAIAQSKERALSKEFNSQLSSNVKNAAATIEQIGERATRGKDNSLVFANSDDANTAMQMVGQLIEAHSVAKEHGNTSTFEQFVSGTVGAKLGASLRGLLDFGMSVEIKAGEKGSETFTDTVKITGANTSNATLTDSKGRTVTNKETLSASEKNGHDKTGMSNISFTTTKETNDLKTVGNAYKEAQKDVVTKNLKREESATVTIPMAITPNVADQLNNQASGFVARSGVRGDNLDKREKEVSGVEDALDVEGGALKKQVTGAVDEEPQVIAANGTLVTKGGVNSAVAGLQNDVEDEVGGSLAATRAAKAKADLNIAAQKAQPYIDETNAALQKFFLAHETAANDSSGEAMQKFKNGEGAEILASAHNFHYKDQAFELSGVVANSSSSTGFDPVFRTGSNEDNYRYIAFNNKGEMRELRVESEEGGGRYYGGYQVNSLDGYTGLVGTSNMHQGKDVGQFMGRDGQSFDNINPHNLGNKPYISLDATGVASPGGDNIQDLAAQSSTGISRSGEPLAGIASQSSVDDAYYYDVAINGDTNSSMAAFQKRHSADWSGRNPG